MSALDDRGFYSFECNRCDTSASDSSRTGVELFSEHHMRTMHPIFAADDPVVRKMGRALRPQRRMRLTSRPEHGPKLRSVS